MNAVSFAAFFTAATRARRLARGDSRDWIARHRRAGRARRHCEHRVASVLFAQETHPRSHVERAVAPPRTPVGCAGVLR